MLSEFEYVFADRLGFLNADHWDQVARFGSVFVSRDYLSALEAAPISNSSMRFGLIYRNASPAACFVTQTLDITGDQLIRSVDQLSIEDRAQLAIKKLTRKTLKQVQRRVTVCGNFVSTGLDGIAWNPDESVDEVWRALSEALYRLRRGEKLYGQPDYVMVKDLPVSAKDNSGVFADLSYRAVETEPNMVLSLDESWRDLAGYFSSLNGKYRKAASSICDKIDQAGVVVTKLNNLEQRRDELHSLYQAVASRADVRLAEMSADYLPSLQAKLGEDRFAILGLQTSTGSLIGFVTVVRDRDTAIGYYLGLDYESNASLPIYHRLLLCVIEQAIDWGCQRISFGRTALEAKARLGCQAEPTFVWVRHRVPLLNVMVRQLLKAVPHDEPPERNPFKAT